VIKCDKWWLITLLTNNSISLFCSKRVWLLNQVFLVLFCKYTIQRLSFRLFIMWTNHLICKLIVPHKFNTGKITTRSDKTTHITWQKDAVCMNFTVRKCNSCLIQMCKKIQMKKITEIFNNWVFPQSFHMPKKMVIQN